MMRNALRIAVTAAMASVVLVLAAGAAVAERNIAVERGGEVSISNGRLTFEETGRGLRVICNTTINGPLTTTGVKKARNLPGGVVGLMKEGRFSGCTEGFGGAAEVVMFSDSEHTTEAEHPIPMTYEAFLGTLPSITGILVLALGLILRITASGMTCNYLGNLGVLMTFPPSGGGNTVALLESSRFRLTTGGLLCPREGFAKGTFRLTPEQRLRLNGFTPSVGTLRAEENPVIIPREAAEKTIHLTNNGNEALSVIETHIQNTRGRLTARLLPRCSILLPAMRCDVLLTVIERGNEGEGPGEGIIRFEYANGGGITELEVPYTIERR